MGSKARALVQKLAEGIKQMEPTRAAA